jgi:hypothetical protein
MPPSGLPVKEDIIANLKTALESIAAGGSYYTTVEQVTRYNGGPMDMTEFPCIVMTPMGTDYGPLASQGTLTSAASFRVNLALYLRSRGASSSLGVDPDMPVTMEKFIRDARQAVIVDRTRNGKAINTFAVSDEVFYPTQDDDPYAVANLVIEINYRTNFDDLNVAT